MRDKPYFNVIIILELFMIADMKINKLYDTYPLSHALGSFLRAMEPAWQNVDTMDNDLRAFYEYNSMHMEPWDGPAGLVLTDGRYAVCLLDRNGLRPSRWVMTKNGYLTVASEIGTYAYKPEDVVAKGNLIVIKLHSPNNIYMLI